MKRRPPSFKASIRQLDALFARYASRPGLLDAVNALSILDGADAPSLTELALAHLRAERGRARAAPPLTIGELFERRAEAFSPAQARSRESARVAGGFFRRTLGDGTPVEGLTHEAILAALDRHRHPRTWNAYFTHLRAACNWAVKRKLIDASPMAGLRPKRIDWSEPAFLPPDRVERVFRIAEAHPGAVESGVGAFLVLSFFAGVRTAEIWRARWEDADLDGAVLRIPQPKGFTRGRKPRLVELEPNAVAWLRLWRDWTAAHAGRAVGRIVRDEHDIRNWKEKNLVPEGLSWGNGEAHNAGRHTYATMHVAAFRNAAATAINLGHIRGTELLDRHYRGLAPQAVAEAYWRIRPSRTPADPEPLPGRGFRSDLRDKGMKNT